MTPGFTRPVDGSIPVQALLYNDEESLASQDGVGIYYGNPLNIKTERSMSQPTAFFTSMLSEWRLLQIVCKNYLSSYWRSH